MARTRIEIEIGEAFSSAVDRRWLRRLVGRVLREEGTGPAAVALVVTDDDTVRRLNADYRGYDETTDVLSFSLREGPPFVFPPDGLAHLGDVVISYPQAARQAGERPVAAEVAQLAVHGLLHLLGYDHGTEEAEARMKEREARLLERLPARES